MSAQGIRLVIRRSDVYGSELMQAVHANFQAMEGEFDKYAEWLYPAYWTSASNKAKVKKMHRTNFIMWDSALKGLESRLLSVISQYGINKVDILAIWY